MMREGAARGYSCICGLFSAAGWRDGCNRMLCVCVHHHTGFHARRLCERSVSARFAICHARRATRYVNPLTNCGPQTDISRRDGGALRRRRACESGVVVVQRAETGAAQHDDVRNLVMLDCQLEQAHKAWHTWRVNVGADALNAVCCGQDASADN